MTNAVTNQNAMTQWPLRNGLKPFGGPAAIPQTLTFTSLITQITQDLTQAVVLVTNAVELVQTLFIDNSQNPSPLTITTGVVNQSVKVPAYSQAFLPILTTTSFFTAVSNGGVRAQANVNVNIHYLTMMLPAAVWPASAAGSIGTDFSANKPALLGSLLTTVPLNIDRQKIEVQNQSANTMQAVLDDGQGNNITIFLLYPNATGANLAGEAWWTTSEKGRLRIFSSSANDQVGVREN